MAPLKEFGVAPVLMAGGALVPKRGFAANWNEGCCCCAGRAAADGMLKGWLCGVGAEGADALDGCFCSDAADPKIVEALAVG